jgi:hypothetical protein
MRKEQCSAGNNKRKCDLAQQNTHFRLNKIMTKILFILESVCILQQACQTSRDYPNTGHLLVDFAGTLPPNFAATLTQITHVQNSSDHKS